MEKIDEIIAELDILNEEKQTILINKDKGYLKIVEESCPHDLFLEIASRNKGNLNIVTIKCLECECEHNYVRDYLPVFYDGSPKVIQWNNKKIKKATRFQILQDEYRRLALKSKTGKIKEEQSRQFALGLSKSCNGKEKK